MSFQFISDNQGNTTGIYIPIQEWRALIQKYEGLEYEVAQTSVPEWQQSEVLKRLNDYKNGVATALDFEQTMSEIEKSL